MSHHELIRVRDVMAATYIIVDGLITVHEGITLARKSEVKALVVKKRDEDDEYGIVLMNDIAKKVLAKNRSPQRTNLYEIMTKPVLSVDAGMNIKYAVRLLFRYRLTRALVLEAGSVVGIVTLRDLTLRSLEQAK